MVFCTYCGQAFTRDEHLERHILTHTNVKPFKCFTCHMSFARRDLLQRHYVVHGKDQNQQEIPASNGIIPKSAGRTPIACSNCAKTKTKCDKKFPCSRCAGRNLKCTLRPTRRTSKNANRVGLIVPPEGLTAMPPHTMQLNGETGETHPLPQSDTLHRRKEQQDHRMASPGNGLAGIAEDKQAAPTVGVAFPQVAKQSPDDAGLPIPLPITPPGQQVHDISHTNQSMSELEDFDHIEDSDLASSPRFMLDWAQMQMPGGFDGVMQPDMMIDPDLTFDPDTMQLLFSGQNGVFPDMTEGMPPLITPTETPPVENAFSDLELGRCINAINSRRHTSSSVQSMDDIDAIVAAQDSWSVFRCTPTRAPSACPKTARLNLERLESSLKDHAGWSTWSPRPFEDDALGRNHLSVTPLHESTRDKLLAITQTFLHKALEIHSDSLLSHQDPVGARRGSLNPSTSSSFVLLPPARVLELFLQSYSNCFERFYPITSRGVLDINELVHGDNDRAACLLVLMMIAQGARNIPDVAAGSLTGGLAEACRISLFDMIEKNIALAADPMILHSALLFVVQAAWSGDKWQMDIAMGQRGMYIAMLRHSGLLGHTAPMRPAGEDQHDTDYHWIEWIRKETRSRLVYSWAMVDQDLSLFHDTAPLFSVTEFAVPMPDADRLWYAKSGEEWATTFEQVHEFSGGYSSVGSGARPLSLQDMFRHFLDDEMIALGIEMTPLQMRLLLHPLQGLVCQYSQLLSCFSDSHTPRHKSSRAITTTTTRSRLEEVQSLLQRWFDLAERYLKANPMCAMMQTNLTIFHLISMNAVTNLPEIERLARRENTDGSTQSLLRIHKRCIHDVEESVFHCGQVLRLVRNMPRSIRPPWWSAAIYRAALVLWADSLVHNNSQPLPTNGAITPGAGPSFAIDTLPSDHPLIVRYLTKREGVPYVTKSDGSQQAIDQPYQILQHCIEVINEGSASQLSDGIRNKMDRLAHS